MRVHVCLGVYGRIVCIFSVPLILMCVLALCSCVQVLCAWVLHRCTCLYVAMRIVSVCAFFVRAGNESNSLY